MKDFCQASRNQFKISANKQDWRIMISCNNGKSYRNTSNAIRCPKSNTVDISKEILKHKKMLNI